MSMRAEWLENVELSIYNSWIYKFYILTPAIKLEKLEAIIAVKLVLAFKFKVEFSK